MGKSAAEIVDKFNRTLKEAIDWEKQIQVLVYPNLQGELANVITQDVWESNKGLTTQDGFSFYRHLQAAIEDPSNGFNLLSSDSYSTFSSIVSTLTQQLHKSSEFTYTKDLTVNADLQEPDSQGKYIKSVKITAVRNVAGNPFTTALTTDQRESIQTSISTSLESLHGDSAGAYTPLIAISKTEQKKMISDGSLFKKPTGCREGDWPGYRGVFKNSEGDLIAWIHAQEHLTLISKSQSSLVIPRIQQLSNALIQLEQSLQFSVHEQFGNLSSSLYNIGTGLELSVTISLSKSPSQENFDSFLSENSLKYTKEGDDFEITYAKRLGVSEAQSFVEFVAGLKKLVDMEDQL